MVGGHSEPKEVTGELIDKFKQYQPIVEEAAGRNFEIFDPLSYTSQVVAGVNYRVKISTDENEYVHVQIYQPLPHTNEPARVTKFVDNVEMDADLNF